MSYETSILSSFSKALLVPGAFSSSSDVIMFSDIFCEWTGKRKGSQKEAANHVPDKMVDIKEPSLEPKAHTSNNKSRCPVEVYKAFRSHRSEAMLEPDAPFYLAINHRRKPNDKVWYLDRPLGKNEIGKFLKDAFAAAKLDDTNKEKVSNRSVRKTSVGQLLEGDVQPNFVAQLSGHKKLKSLNSYYSAF